MFRRRAVLALPLIALVCAAALLPPAVPGAGKKIITSDTANGKEIVYVGNVIYLGGRRTTVTNFTLRIREFTPDEEVIRLGQKLKSGGQDDLLKEISKQKKGSIQIESQLARDIGAVWTSDSGEFRKITALAERWIGFFEARRGSRSLDYPFTYIELYVDARGNGEGSLIPAARVQAKDPRDWDVENFGIYPARLTNVKQRTS